MIYLVDTNVLSELRRKTPDANVVAWMRQRRPASLYLSVLTLGELRKGIESLPDGEKRQQLQDWLENDLPIFFSGRVLGIDEAVAQRWGRLQAEMGRPIPAVDSLLAAQALHRGLTLVTRNEKDFNFPGLDVINPWNG